MMDVPEYVYIDGLLLECPVCDENYLHQNYVQVIFRDREDGDGDCVKVDRNGETVTRLKGNEIPGRRHVIDIGFYCECSAVLCLRIMQHKGQTLVEWVSIEEATP